MRGGAQISGMTLTPPWGPRVASGASPIVANHLTSHDAGMSDEHKDQTDETPAEEEPTAEESVESDAVDDTEPQEAPAAPTVPPTSPVPPPARRLVRRADGKVIAGVCSGIAAHTGVDPVIVRIAFVLTTLFSGGIGLVAYIVAWLVMPMAPEGEPIVPLPRRDDTNMSRWIGIGAIVVGAIVLFHNVWDFRGGIVWGLLLVGVGIALWGREFAPRSDRPTTPPAPPVPPSGQMSVTAPVPPVAPTSPMTPRYAAATSHAPAPSPARREPSMLGRAVVGAAALAIGIALLLDNTHTLDVTPKGVVAVLLLVVGTGLFIGTWYGRARWLIIPGVILALLLGLLAALPDWRFGDGAGERIWQPQTLSQVRDEYRLGAGELLLDLSDVDFEGETEYVEVSVGFGSIIVVVPDHINVDVEASAGAGEVDLFRRQQGGLGVNQEHLFTGRRRAGQLDLEARVGFGEITLRRAGDAGDLNEVRRGRIDIGANGGLPRISIDTNSSDDEVPTPTGASR